MRGKSVKVVVGSDHGGYILKNTVIEVLTDLQIDFEDYGVFEEKSVDYPDIAQRVSQAVADNKFDKGILLCGTGIGVSIVANKIKGVRAALCGDVFSAVRSREHNDANVLCLGARVIGKGSAEMILKAWLTTEFLKGRHAKRVDMITALENEDQ